jgi:hypothetical protein
MSSFTDTRPQNDHDTDGTVGKRRHEAARRISTETKASFKTTEMVAFVAAVIGVLIASSIVDASDFGAQEAWFYVTLLTIGYMVSRGLAKSGSREHFDADNNR